MDLELGTPLTPSATRMLLLGAGELGREVAIEAMRLGIEVIACDRYRDAPAMQVAHRSHVFDMQDRDAVRAVVGREKPHFIVPEVEAIATEALVELEAEGWTVIPTAMAARLTMDREGIRRLAAETLGLPTSRYAFADTLEQVEAAVREIGLPCVIKPVMSSSGKGQSTIRELSDVPAAWDYALAGARGRSARVIVEGFVRFDSEITLLTIRTRNEGTMFCPPIGHRQERGDYMESWQPHAMTPAALTRAREIAEQVTGALGGYGLFGVELFLVGDEVIFSEVSPRPHDTGMVTMATQDQSQFELHVRAILGLPIVEIIQRAPGASAVILAERAGHNPRFLGLTRALQDPRARVRLFGKPDTRKYRRMGVVLTYGDNVEDARKRATEAARKIEVIVDAG